MSTVYPPASKGTSNGDNLWVTASSVHPVYVTGEAQVTASITGSPIVIAKNPSVSTFTKTTLNTQNINFSNLI